MQTCTDAEIVDWVGRLGAGGVEHVAVRFGLDRRDARERLVLLWREGMIECSGLPEARRSLYWASPVGLSRCGLERLGVWSSNPQGFGYAWQVAQVAVELARGLPDWEVLSAREVAAIEADSAEQFASVEVGGGSRRRVHVPALVLASPRARVVPIEVQPSIGMESSLVWICRGWGRARHVSRVYWLANIGAARAVRRTLRDARATDRVTVLGLDDLSLLVASESAREEVSDVFL